jgi:hypothetical protein
VHAELQLRAVIRLIRRKRRGEEAASGCRRSCRGSGRSRRRRRTQRCWTLRSRLWSSDGCRGPGPLHAQGDPHRPSVCNCFCSASALARALQVRKVAEENGVDVSESIRELEERAMQVRGIPVPMPPACNISLDHTHLAVAFVCLMGSTRFLTHCASWWLSRC